MVYKKKQAAFINEKLLQEIGHRNVNSKKKELEIQKKNSRRKRGEFLTICMMIWVQEFQR